MARPCPNQVETATGWYCPEVMRLRDELARVKEENKRLKDENRRLKKEKGREPRSPMEEVFGDSTPSSQRLKPVSSEENRARRGGAKPGHAPHCRHAASPETADEIRLAEAPDKCPRCGGPLEPAGECLRTVRDMEPVRHREVLWRLGRRRCPRCNRFFRARPPGVLPRAGATDRLLAQTAAMAYAEMVPMGTVSRLSGINTGTLHGMMDFLARLLEPCMAAVAAAVRSSGVVNADESPWRMDGAGGYVWFFAGDAAVLVLCRQTRAGAVAAEALVGIAATAVVVTDRYAGYNKALGACRRQLCFEHLRRDLKKVEKENPKSAECARFVEAVLPLLSEAMSLRRREKERDRYLKRARELKEAIMGRMRRQARHPSVRNYQDIFREREGELFHWVEDPAVPAENNRAERMVRPLAVARKVSHGSQSERGLQVREVLMSVLLTLRMRHGERMPAVLSAALDRLAADPGVDLVRELFPEYNPAKADAEPAPREA